MRRAFAVLGALAGAGACGDTTTSSGPNVLVFRETSRGCMVLLSGSDDGAVFTRPEGAPGTAVTCGSGSADGATQGSGGPFVVCGSDPAISEVGGVRPGIDVLDVVIDYGSDLSASGVLTAPVLTLYFDGVGSAAPAPTLQPRLDNHTYYTGSIVVPAVESNDITLGVSVVNGFSTTVPTTFKAYVPPIVFSLYRITNGGMQLVGLAALPAIVPSTTAGSTIGSGALLAGTDTALLALDYGSLDIPTSKVLAPMLSLLVNDAPLSVTATSSPQQCSSDAHTYFFDTFPAPALVTSDLQLAVQATPTAAVRDSMTYSLELPPLGVTQQARLSVLRKASSGLQLVAGNPPSADLGLGTIMAAGSSNALNAGIDQLELVIDYGDLDLPLNVNAALPQPTVALLASGQAITTDLAIRAQPEKNGHTYFLGAMTAPNMLTPSLSFQVTGGLGFSLSDGQSYSLQDPVGLTPSLLVEEGSGCFTPLGSADPALAALGLNGLCTPAPSPVPSAAAATVDELELVIDYGALDTSNPSIPMPVATVVVDDVQLGAPLTLRAQTGSGHTYYLTNFHAPAATTGAAVKVATSADPTPRYSIAIPLTPPAPTLTIDECASMPCVVHGALGSLHLHASTQGDVVQTISISGSMSGGAQAPAVPAITTSGALGHNSGSIMVPIPPVPDGTVWTLQAKLGSQSSPAQQITIRAPNIGASIGCASPCTQAESPASAPVYIGLTVTAPSEIQSPTMTVSTFIGGVPDIASAVYALTTSDPIADTLSTSVPLAVPSTPGTWEIVVSVDGYIQTFVVTVI